MVAAYGLALLVQEQPASPIGAPFDVRRGAAILPELCRFLGRRNDVTLHALMRPASEKRQGTKSRSVVHRRCGGRYRELTDAHELEAE